MYFSRGIPRIVAMCLAFILGLYALRTGVFAESNEQAAYGSSSDGTAARVGSLSLGISRSCSTEDELRDALGDVDVTDIYLSSDIVITGYFASYDSEATLHLGEHSIIIEGPEDPDDYWSSYGKLDLYGHVTVLGYSVGIIQNPGSSLALGGGARVEMTGDNARALVLTDYEEASLEFAEIAVSGKNAVGILGLDEEHPLRLWLLRVTAEGEGAAAVRSDSPELFMASQCTLESDGGPALELAGDAYAYRSVIDPLPPGIISAEGVLLEKMPCKRAVYQDFAKGPDQLYLDSDWFFDYIFDSPTPDAEPEYADQNHVLTLFCPITWDMENFDISTPGVYNLTGRVSPPIAMPGLPVSEVSCEVTVVALDKPYIEEAGGATEDEDGVSVVVDLYLLAEIPDAEEIIVWCSLDRGETWSDITAESRAELHNDGWWPYISVGGLEDDTQYHFCVEVLGGSMPGYTNIVWTYTYLGGGGDRDYLDRDPEKYGTSQPPQHLGPPDKEEPGEQNPEPPAIPIDPPGEPIPELPVDPNTPTGNMIPESPSSNSSSGSSRSKGGDSGSVITNAAGDDENGIKFSDLEEAAPMPVSAPSVELPTAADEQELQSEPLPGVRLTRQHLLDLITANPRSVTLFFGDVRLAIPTDALERLLGNSQSINLEVSIPNEETILIRLWSGQSEISLIEEGFTVIFPYNGEASASGIYYLIQNRNKVSAQYQNGELTAIIQGLGEYAVIFEDTYALTAESDVPAAPNELLTQPESSPNSSSDRSIWPTLVIAAIFTICPAAAVCRLKQRNR